MGEAPDITFQRERLSPILWGEILPLLHAHHAEAGATDALDVDVARYDLMDEHDHLRLYTARAAAALVGYAAFFVGTHIRYRTRTIATHDVVYLAPAHRGFAGAQLLAFADRELARDGVHQIRHAAKPDTPFAALLERLGYQRREVTFDKEPAHG